MTSPFADSIRQQLMVAAYRERRRRRFTIGALLSGAVAAATSSLIFLAPSPASADVEVTVRDGYVEVRLTDLESTPKDVVDALREKGFDARVAAAPTGPSAVGTLLFVSVAGDPDKVEQIGDTKRFLAFRVEAGWSGELAITLGRAARDGEAYDSPTDPFAVGEPLRCQGVLGRQLADVEEKLSDFDVDVHLTDAGIVLERVALGDAEFSHPTWVVTGGHAFADDEVLLVAEQVPAREEAGC